MAAQLLDGVQTAREIKTELSHRVQALNQQGIEPALATVLVGSDPGSLWYVAGKHRDCAEVGIRSIRLDLPESTSQSQLLEEIDRLNRSVDITGYIVQLPLPPQLDSQVVLEHIDPEKDADGLHPINLGRLVSRVGGPIDSPLPCTPRAVIELLARHGISLSGQHVVVVGRGVTVGRSIGLLLTRRGIDATVTLTHSRTPDLGDHLRRADVIVAAAGVPHIVDPADVKPGAIVLDVGVSRRDDPVTGRVSIVGDVDPAVSKAASWISPNPGGVGPMTRALLLANVVDMAERRSGVAGG